MKYWVNGVLTDFATLSEEEIQEVLDKHRCDKTGASKIACSCVSDDLLLHPYERNSHLFLRKAKMTGGKHYSGCRHYDLTQERAAVLGYAEGVVESDQEDLVVSLPTSLKPRRPAVAVTRVPHEHVASGGRRVRRNLATRITELGLLHTLWERGQLTFHRPGVPTGCPWPSVRYAATSIRPKGMRGLEWGLSDILLLPCHAETPNQGNRNWKKLSDSHEKRHVLYVAQLPGEVAPENWTGG